MKVRKYQASEEKTILIAMIVNTRVLSYIHAELSRDPKGPFKNKWSNLIAKWCFEYFEKHAKAPGKVIQSIFVSYAARETEDDNAKLVESFLEDLSGEYAKLKEGLNEQWVLDKAAEFFNKVRMERMAEEVQAALESHDIGRAQEVRDGAQPVSFSRSAWHNPFTDRAIRETLEDIDNDDSIVKFKGDLGRFLNAHFERGSFIAFAGPEKMGKSFWLEEVVWLGLNQRRKVLYYIIGDMSEKQARRRLYSRATLKPKSRLRKVLRIPTGIKFAGKDDAGRPKVDVTFREETREPYTEVDIKRAVEELKMNAAMRQFPLRLKCIGGDLTASGIRRDIDELIREGFTPDLVVVDYLDLLDPEPSVSKLDPRHQINKTWKICRQISLDYHLCFVGATQAAARAYDQWLIRKKDFSEDKRKNAHVTGMLGLNRTPDEKQKGIYRLNWVFLRDGEWTETQCVWTAGNLALACPCLRSLLR